MLRLASRRLLATSKLSQQKHSKNESINIEPEDLKYSYSKQIVPKPPMPVTHDENNTIVDAINQLIPENPFKFAVVKIGKRQSKLNII